MEMPRSNTSFEVNYRLFLLDIYGVLYDDYKVDVSIYLVLSWFDDRVNWTNINSRNTTENVDALFIDHLWTPDLYFYNTREPGHPQEKARRGLWLQRTEESTQVTIAMEMDLSMICPMDVTAFPFDSHTCNLKFSSFARKSDELAFVRISENDEEPNDQLDPERVQDFAANASYFKENEVKVPSWLFPKKEYSVGGIKIRLVRDASKFTSIYYLPTTMFTLTSWVSFLLPPTSYPA